MLIIWSQHFFKTFFENVYRQRRRLLIYHRLILMSIIFIKKVINNKRGPYWHYIILFDLQSNPYYCLLSLSEYTCYTLMDQQFF